MEDDVVEWITINHQHVPIKKGENKREVARNFIKNKMSRVQKNKDKYDKIAEFKKRKATNNKFNDDKEFEHKKIKKFEIRDNKYIPIREGEDEKEVLRKYEERENPEYRRNIKEAQDNERALQSGIITKQGEEGKKDIEEAQKRKGQLTNFDRRGALMIFTQDNKELIDKWVSEFDDETRKRVGEKVLNKQPLTMKEYYGYLGSSGRPGDVILEEFPDGENAVIANDGKWVRQSRVKAYNKNPKANQDAVYSQKDEDEWERQNAEQLDQIERFKKRKSTNK